MKYEPGELRVVTYKKGEKWAEEVIKTTREPAALIVTVDRSNIKADGRDISFITLQVVDENGLVVPTASNLIQFTVEGPGEIVATDNGDPTDMTFLTSPERKAFNGLALAIIRSNKGEPGSINVSATSPGLKPAEIMLKTTR